mmetsp:Transcript_101971/g.186211  ORF Transcript_101971/g.186211 Transcript_101971/m.186211 type:complete len:288 (+) Transcript_101971:69-932(+)
MWAASFCAARILALALCMHPSEGYRFQLDQEDKSNLVVQGECDSLLPPMLTPEELERAGKEAGKNAGTMKLEELEKRLASAEEQKNQASGNRDYRTAFQWRRCAVEISKILNAEKSKIGPKKQVTKPFAYEGCTHQLSVVIKSNCPFRPGELVNSTYNASDDRLASWARQVFAQVGIQDRTKGQTFASHAKLFIRSSLIKDKESGEEFPQVDELTWGQPNPSFTPVTTMEAAAVYLCARVHGDDAQEQITFLLKKNLVDRMLSHGATSTANAQKMYKDIRKPQPWRY